MGYTPNYSHLIGIMISKTIGFRGTQHFQTNPVGNPKKIECLTCRSWPQEGKIGVFVSSIFSHFSPVVCGLLGATLYNVQYVQMYTNVLFKCIIHDNINYYCIYRVIYPIQWRIDFDATWFLARSRRRFAPGTAMDLFSGEEFWMLPVAWEGGSLGQAEMSVVFPNRGKVRLGMHCEFYGPQGNVFWNIMGIFSGD